MHMGGSSMHAAPVQLQSLSGGHLWRGIIAFSMTGPWIVDVSYDGRHLSVPVNVSGTP
jgi:hypothetical protein